MQNFYLNISTCVYTSNVANALFNFALFHHMYLSIWLSMFCLPDPYDTAVEKLVPSMSE